MLRRKERNHFRRLTPASSEFQQSARQAILIPRGFSSWVDQTLMSANAKALEMLIQGGKIKITYVNEYPQHGLAA